MTISDAKNMIAAATSASEPQAWIDLGCGAGTFTLALAALLPPGSEVTGVDKAQQNLPERSANGNIIKFIKSDIVNLSVEPNVDGVLMANALHYIRDQEGFIERLLTIMNRRFRLLLVEYDNDRPNPWVPYPVSFSRLQNLFKSPIFRIEKLNESASVYGQGNMYAALITLHH
ncbi:class I SAM-dependent methyltransferase [Niabella insulamsoli]|uniref:class I SAM-dependent methyltransferase n=1 Tax=Niabella insulamsoli TaxID=3144874 RepID=UPI0031FD4DE5